MIDRELINRKLLLIGQDFEKLIGLAQLDEADYLQNSINEDLAERYLERMIGRMIDINYHLLVESGQAPPPDYYQSFMRLGDLGVYDGGFSKKIASAAGLRNRLVHEYDAVDAELVYQAILSAQTDIPQYVQAVQAFLQKACR